MGLGKDDNVLGSEKIICTIGIAVNVSNRM